MRWAKNLLVSSILSLFLVHPGNAFQLTRTHVPSSRPWLQIEKTSFQLDTIRTHISPGCSNRNPLPWTKYRQNTQQQTTHRSRSALFQSSSSSSDDIYFNSKTTVALVAGQSVLVVLAVVLGTVLGIPNKGLGPDVAFTAEAWKAGALYTLPLVGLAAALDVIEDKVPALQDVTKATQRSVLGLLGGTFKPFLGLVIASVLGLAAGFGEEMLFRGILQFELVSRVGSSAVAIGASSILFGALHAVTPMYAFLATLASIYFGSLYVSTGNLAVPILCHALYDVGALLYAHWTVSRLEATERENIAKWPGPSAGPL